MEEKFNSRPHNEPVNWELLVDNLRFTYKNSLYYREKWDKLGIKLEDIINQKDFDRIPFTTKEDLRNAYPTKMLAVNWNEVSIIHESSGTTGKATASFFTEEDLKEWYSRLTRNGIGLNSNDIVLIKTPYSMLSTAHQMHGFSLMVGATILPAGNRSSLMPYTRVVRILSDYRPTVLYCIPIELVLFARKAINMGKNPSQDFPWIRGCVVNGEMLSEGKRLYIESLWNTKIYEDYGSTETTTLGGVCSHGKMHAWADRYYMEIQDKSSGACNQYGTGELIITSLYRKAMPLIRYRMGDRVTLTKNQCSCGLDLPNIKVLGRVSDKILCQGKSIFPIEIEDIIYRHFIGFGPIFWKTIYDEQQMEILIEGMENEKTCIKEVVKNLKGSIIENLGLDVSINVVPEGTIMTLDYDQEETMTQKPKYIQYKVSSGYGLNYK